MAYTFVCQKLSVPMCTLLSDGVSGIIRITLTFCVYILQNN